MNQFGASSTGFFNCFHIDGLVQERRNFIANALELRHSCTKPLNYDFTINAISAIHQFLLTH